MAFDLAKLHELTARHGRIARIVVAASKGSAPREAGAAMWVWAEGQDNTIGGGALEFQAVQAARLLLCGQKGRQLTHIPLGPALGQCCGGSVSLLTEVFTQTDCARLSDLARQSLPYCRPVGDEKAEIPLPVSRLLNLARAQGVTPAATLAAGWLVESFVGPRKDLWIYGAGHVGRALVTVLSPLGYEICWIDTAAERFPDALPINVTRLVAADPARVVAHAPAQARHLVLTYSHALDLEICHRILSRDFGFAGVIGSATKWARFRSRLDSLGHNGAQINRIACPIGLPELGKTPEAIAVGVATKLLIEDAAILASPKPVKEHAI